MDNLFENVTRSHSLLSSSPLSQLPHFLPFNLQPSPFSTLLPNLLTSFSFPFSFFASLALLAFSCSPPVSLVSAINLNNSRCGPQTSEVRSVDAQPISRALTATVSWLTHSFSHEGCDRVRTCLVLIRRFCYTVSDWGEIKTGPS